MPAADAPALAARMLGGTLVTKQTGAAGKPVNTLLVARKMDIAREMYLAILLDRKAAGPVVVACSEGKQWGRGGGEGRGAAAQLLLWSGTRARARAHHPHHHHPTHSFSRLFPLPPIHTHKAAPPSRTWPTPTRTRLSRCRSTPGSA